MQIEFPAQKIETKVEWKALFRQNLNYILWFLVALIGLGALLTRMVGRESASLNDFYQANFQLNRLDGKGEVNEAILSELVGDHPELKPAFSSYLTQKAVDQGQIEELKALTTESLNRLAYINSNYLEYVRGSLAIQEGEYDVALDRAIALQDQISLENEPKLYLFNALRIGFLHRILRHDGEAKKQLLYLKALLTEEQKGVSVKLQSEMAAHLRSGQLSLFDLVEGAR